MIEDLGSILSLFGGGAGMTGGGYAFWQARQNRHDIEDVKKSVSIQREKLADHILYSANHYSKNDDLRELSKKMDTVIDRLTDINVSLAGKADK